MHLRVITIVACYPEGCWISHGYFDHKNTKLTLYRTENQRGHRRGTLNHVRSGVIHTEEQCMRVQPHYMDNYTNAPRSNDSRRPLIQCT
jgi:hypothetical protein